MKIEITRADITLTPENEAETYQLQGIVEQCGKLGVEVGVDRQWEIKKVFLTLKRE